MNSKELKQKISELEYELKKVEHKEKAKKGYLKCGEYCVATFFEYDGNDKLIAADSDPIVFFMPWGQENPVPMAEAYIDWCTPYFVDLINCRNSWEGIKVKKISKEEAFKLLEK